MTEVPTAPTTCISLRDEKYVIKVDLPDTSKEDIDLKVTRRSINITIPKYDYEFSPNFDLKYDILPEKVKARFSGGVLEIEAPLSESLGGKEVKIE